MIKIINYEDAGNSVFDRNFDLSSVTETVKAIIKDVRINKDKALIKYTEKFDGFTPKNIELSKEQIDECYNRVDKDLIAVMERSAENIRAFHSMQVRKGFKIETDNKIIGQMIIPLSRVGIYVPGGKAAYPSTVLMNGIPAKIAGVGEIIMVTPTPRGELNDKVIAAAKIAGVDRIFTVGGAQAVAAVAYGTETIPKCDKIVGPGNAFVASAKREIYGDCGIDMIAGPSEIMIISDAKSKPENVAADLLSQAEHDENASAVLVTVCNDFANEVASEIEKQLKLLSKEKIASESIKNNGKIILVSDIESAIEVANIWAPEHLELDVEKPFDYLDKIVNAGSVFLGRNTPEPVGDYYAGCNHTLPTSGTAKFSSPLSVDDFIKKTQYMYYTQTEIKNCADDIALFAKSEGLTAHAESVIKRK